MRQQEFFDSHIRNRLSRNGTSSTLIGRNCFITCRQKECHGWRLGQRFMAMKPREFWNKEHTKTDKLPNPFEMTKKYVEHLKEDKKRGKNPPAVEKSSSTKNWWREFTRDSSAFNLTPSPLHLTRRAQIAKLRLSESKAYREKRNTILNQAIVSLSTYPLSYYPIELRFGDINNYVEQQNMKRQNKEETKALSEKLEKDRKDKKKRESMKNSKSWANTVRLALEVQKNETLENCEQKHEQEKNGQKDEEKELFVPGLNNFDTSLVENHPYQIKWNFYCQARNDWQRRLNQYFPEIMGKSTESNRQILAVLALSVLFYGLCAMTTNIYYKFSLVIRYQLILSAAIVSYTAGILWGYGIGNLYLIQRLQKSHSLVCGYLVFSSALSLGVAAYNYNLGYTLMNFTCLTTIGILHWLRHRGLIQSWKIHYLVPLLATCIMTQLIGQCRAAQLKQVSEDFVNEADLGDYFSITSIVKSVVPQRLRDILFYDETEIVNDDYNSQNDDQ